MAVELQTILTNIDLISAKINDNVFIKNARTSVKEGLESFAVEEDEKAKIYASFEQQLSATVINNIINVAKELPTIQAQEELIREQIKVQNKEYLIKDQQEIAEKIKNGGIYYEYTYYAEDAPEVISGDVEVGDVKTKTLMDGTTKSLYEAQKDEHEARTRNIDEDTQIKTEQIKTEKGKTLHIIEQITSEKYRHRDLRAGTAVKLGSLEVTKQQAKFEESRRYIAIAANHQNAYMKQSDFKVQQLQAIATDDDIVISDDHIEDTKTQIESIPTDKITYESEVSLTKPTIESTKIDSITIT